MAGTLGLDVREDKQMGILEIHSPDKSHMLVYPKPDHQPADFTVLNLQVRDIDEAVDALTSAGIKFERYNTPDIKTDAKGIARGDKKGPSIACSATHRATSCRCSRATSPNERVPVTEAPPVIDRRRLSGCAAISEMTGRRHHS